MTARPNAFVVALLAISVPLLLSSATVPDPVLHNQLAAVAGWGLWLCCFEASPRVIRRPAWGILIGFGVVIGVIMIRTGSGNLLSLASLLAASAVFLAAARGASSGAVAIATAWFVAGCGSVVVAAVQYFAPSMADGLLIALNPSPGRAIGNMRQPNHLGTALLCAIVWTAWLWQVQRRPRAWWCGIAIVAMVLGVAMSASRTAAVSLGILSAWALLDRNLPRTARWVLGLAPLVWGGAWMALAGYASLEHGQFYGTARLHADGDVSSSRFAIWRNALVLLAENPWVGVGWGNFNFAWTFTPFPDRPVAFFDHTHNLPLQLAVELGIPLTMGLLALLGCSLWCARGAWRRGDSEPRHPARAAAVMLAALGVHSLLEYPLWYTYFLLPAAWALGLFLGSQPVSVASRQTPRSSLALRATGALMVAGVVYAAWDHRRIEVIFAPSVDALPLERRIADGRRSVLFRHHADYAAVTTEPADHRLESFSRPLHQLVDVRLLIAYVEALKANGRTAEALYAAQRLREFRRDDAQAYFKSCSDTPRVPLHCDTRPVPLTWRDLEP